MVADGNPNNSGCGGVFIAVQVEHCKSILYIGYTQPADIGLGEVLSHSAKVDLHAGPRGAIENQRLRVGGVAQIQAQAEGHCGCGCELQVSFTGHPHQRPNGVKFGDAVGQRGQIQVEGHTGAEGFSEAEIKLEQIQVEQFDGDQG